MNDWTEMLECRQCGVLQDRSNFTIDEDVLYCDDCVRLNEQAHIDETLDK